MSGDWIGDMLAKLSEKTGREWTMLDLLRLAQKLPELNDSNVDALLSELSEMGLTLSDKKKNAIKEKVIGENALTPADLPALKRRLKGKSARETARKKQGRVKRSKRKGARPADGRKIADNVMRQLNRRGRKKRM
ncbi:MAG: hypothetical protein H0Z34_13635 [Brevibacillus sp.]|nr:hypothetical protein [Brevibacillus sp.]